MNNNLKTATQEDRKTLVEIWKVLIDNNFKRADEPNKLQHSFRNDVAYIMNDRVVIQHLTPNTKRVLFTANYYCLNVLKKEIT